MAAALADTVQPVVIVGHSHVPLTATVEDRQLTAAHAPGGTEFDYSGRRVLLNPGWSASRGTATPTRRTSFWTWPSSARRSAASNTTSSERSGRYSTKGCRSRSRSG